MDGIFGAGQFQNEIVWQRTTPKGHAFTRFPSTHDIIFAYRKGEEAKWNTIYLPHRDEYVQSHYRNVEQGSGRRYMLDNCLNPNPDRPNLTYEWKGITRVWRWTREKMQALDKVGRLAYTKSGMPRYKRYLDEMPGTPVTSVWADISPINSQAQERLGYPTQKPQALLERIISASSDPGDVILDPFCGCGTAVHAAEKLGRNWVGIDVTHIAIQIIENRLAKHFPGKRFPVYGRPTDLDGAADLATRDKYQFQWWATWLAGGVPRGGERKGADRGVDGEMYFKTGAREDAKAIISVKGGHNVGPSMIRDLIGTMQAEEAEMGIFISLAAPTQEMKKAAAAAGIWNGPAGRFPRIQIRTIKDLLDGRKVETPPLYNTVTAAAAAKQVASRNAKAPPQRDRRQRNILLPLAGKAKGQPSSKRNLELDLEADASPRKARRRSTG